MPIFGQKTSILLKLHYFMVIKVNRMLFLFRFFTKKSLLSCPYFIKNTSILLKHTALIPILVKKTSILSKTRCSHVFFFFKFFMKNSCYRAHDWSKNVNSVKTTLYSGPKKSIWCSFFLFLTKKITALMSIFCQKTFIL